MRCLILSMKLRFHLIRRSSDYLTAIEVHATAIGQINGHGTRVDIDVVTKNDAVGTTAEKRNI